MVSVLFKTTLASHGVPVSSSAHVSLFDDGLNKKSEQAI